MSEPTNTQPCDLPDCESYREWLSGEKADADKRARQAETKLESTRDLLRLAEESAWDAQQELDRLAAFVDKLRDLAFMGGQNGESVRRFVIQAFVEHDGEDRS